MYTILGCLGEGRFSRVWLASRPDGRHVAMKEDLQEQGEKASWSTLAHEAAVLYHLNRMGAVGPTLHWFEGGPQPHLVMSLLLPCPSLVWPQMVQAIERVHACGILHRDIKPEHFMLDPRSDTLVLTDFGFAVFMDQEDQEDQKEKEKGKDQHIVGSPRYCSVHVHEGQAYRRRDDLLSALYCTVDLVPYRGGETASISQSACAHPRNRWYGAQKEQAHMETLVPPTRLQVVRRLYALSAYAAPDYAGLM